MDYLSIEEASQLTTKNPTTIRRLIKKLLEKDQTAKNNIQQEKTVSGFRYKIDKEYLLTHMQPIHSPEQQRTQQPIRQTQHISTQEKLSEDTSLLKAKDETIGKQDETIAILREQLKQKDEQIKEMLKRDGERNILFHKFQDALMLEAPNKNSTFTDTPIQKPIQPVTQDTVHQGIQPIQPVEKVTSNELTRKHQPRKRFGTKPKFGKGDKPKNSEKPKKKGLFSWFS